MKKILMMAAVFSLCSNVYAFLPVAKIIEVKGNAKINTEIAKVGLEIAEGNKIELKRGDKLIIEFQNGHKISLSNATVMFDILNPKNALINLERGGIFVMINSLTPNENFHIRAGNVVVASDVATFLMDNNGKKTKVAVESGKIQVQRLKEAMELTALEEANFDRSPSFEKKKIKLTQIKNAKKLFW